ncbi:MAG: alginate export family protein [Thermodesulfobacteriota bacterium]
MKRILLSVFAAALTAAWAVPATAASVDFSGQYRLRGEFRDNKDFDENNTDTNSDYLQRVRLTANAQATSDTSVKITIQDSRTWGTNVTTKGTPGVTSGPGLTDANNNTSLDLHESYVLVKDLFGSPISAKIGRQQLVYGDQRLIGAFGWDNRARSFDAIKFSYGSEMVNVDAWTSKVRENTTSDNDQDFYGLYATVKAVPNNTVDVYALYLRDGSTTAFVGNNTTSNAVFTGAGAINKPQDLWTYGLRVKGNWNAVDYTGEIAGQTGTIDKATASFDLSGTMVTIKGGYTLPLQAAKVRVGAEYDYASGDSNPGDNDMETFTNLFPTNHGHYGYADVQGLRNTSTWGINAKAQVNPQLSLYAAYWNFTLAEEHDNWYGAGDWMSNPTAGFRTGNATNTQDEAASEVDLVATYKYNSAFTAQLGYSLVTTGDLTDSKIAGAGGQAADQDFAYLMLTANF